MRRSSDGAPLFPADLAAAWAVSRDHIQRAVRSAAAERALASLPADARQCLLDGAGSVAAAAAAVARHAAEALVAERLVAREAGEHARPLLAALDDDLAGAALRALPAATREAAVRAVDAALPPGMPDLHVELFPTSFSERAQKRRGGVYTEALLAEQLLDLVGWDGRGRLLEPAVGAGAFLLPAWERALAAAEQDGRDPVAVAHDLAAVDVHPFACRAARTALARLAAARGLSAAALPQVARADALLAPSPAPSADLGAWDVVIGNPPFVRGERIPAALRTAYREDARELTGNVDLVAYFVLRALRWLRPGGRLGLVVPQGLLEARACTGLRALLAERTVEAVVTLEWAPGLFADAAVIPCLLVVRDDPPRRAHSVRLGSGRWGARGDLDVAWSRVRQTRWLSLAVGGRWPPLVRREDLSFLQRLRAAPTPLKAGYGLAIRTRTGAAALIAEGEPPPHFRDPRPLLDGREVRPWRIESGGRWLDYRPEAISDPKSEAFFAAPKVLVPRIALTPMAAVDEGDPPFVARNTVMVVRAPGTLLDQGPDGPWALAALINSLPLRVYAFLLLRAGALAGSHRATLYAGVIDAFPVPAPLLEDAAAVERLGALGRAAEKATRRATEDLPALEQEVDVAVAAAFDLDEATLGRLRRRAAQEPLASVLAPPAPGSRTRAIAVRRYAVGERYR